MDAYRLLVDLVVYQECLRMLNGMERTLEKQLPESDGSWPQPSVKSANDCADPTDFLNPDRPNPET